MYRSDLRIAYILLVHKNPTQVNLFLWQLLVDEQADIYVHMDKKNYPELSKKIISHPRVFVVKENISVTWGDISLVEATLILLKEVVDSGKNYDFICLRSGQDLIVKSGYKEYLSENKDKNFLIAEKVDEENSFAAGVYLRWPKKMRCLYDSIHPYRILRSLLKRLYGLGINLFPVTNKLPKDFKLFLGSEWFCITMQLGGYIMNYLDENPWYSLAFKDVLAPDTWFFQTLILNSPYAQSVVNENHVYLRWGKTFKDANHPVIITKDNVMGIEKTEAFFARKFDERIDNDVIQYFCNKIEEVEKKVCV